MIFAYEFYYFKIYDSICRSQTQIEENADNFVESYSPTGVVTVSLQCQLGLNLPERFLQNNLNIIYYNQNLDTNNEQYCGCYYDTGFTIYYTSCYQVLA